MESQNILCERINALINKHGISQSELSEKTGISKQVISAICKGKIKHSKGLHTIARHFGVDYQWLMGDGNSKTEQSDVLILHKFKKIPLITNETLTKSMLKNGKISFSNASFHYEITSDPEHESLFCLMSTNNSLKCRFGQNCPLIFHTQIEPEDGDFVIAYLPDKDLFIYRDLELKNGKRHLIPIDKDLYKPMTLKEQDLIVAVLYEKRVKRPFHRL